jgi:hypothetical protein
VTKTVVLGGLAFALLASPAAWANGKGNGGGAFVCRDAAHAIRSAELVDLYEGRAQFGLTLRDEEGAPTARAEAALARLGRPEYVAAYGRVREKLRVVPDAKLENTYDFDLILSPKTCAGGTIQFEQLANFTNTGELIVSQEIWDRLGPAQQAALLVHESVYLYLRETFGTKSSREARRVVAYAFSTLEPGAYPADLFAFKREVSQDAAEILAALLSREGAGKSQEFAQYADHILSVTIAEDASADVTEYRIRGIDLRWGEVPCGEGEMVIRRTWEPQVGFPGSKVATYRTEVRGQSHCPKTK